MFKVGILDRRVGKLFLQISGGISAAVSLTVIFFDIPSAYKLYAAIALLVVFALCYVAVWLWANQLTSIKLD